MENKEKKPKKRSRAGLVLLVIFLILAGAVGYVYYTVCKAPLALDDPQKLAATAPMDPEERFAFSAADQTVQVKMDKTDLWSLILSHAGDDFLNKINKELSGYGLTVSGCAINIGEEALGLDLELSYKETRLVAKVPCALAFENGKFALTPTGVKLGVIPLPVSGLLSRVKLEYDMELPVLTEVTDIDYVQDALILTGSMEQDIRALVSDAEKLDQAAVFSEDLRPLALTLQDPEGMDTLLAHLEKKPEDMEALYRSLFVMSTADITEDYLESRHGMTERFFPGIDFAAVAEEQELVRSTLISQMLRLEKLFTELVNTYNEKRVKLENGEFLIELRHPFRAAEYDQGEYLDLFETVLDPEAVFLILVDAEQGFIRKTPSFYRLCDENQQFTQPVDFDKTYTLGLVFRNVTGNPYLLYEEEINDGSFYYRNIVKHPLTEAEVAALQVPETFGIWTDK